MANGPAIPPEIEALRGKEFTFQAAEEVSRANIHLFALAINHRDPLFYDQEKARHSKYHGIVAPPTMVCETFQYRTDQLNEAGYPIDWVEPPVGQVLRANNDYEFFEPMRPDDVLSVRMRFSDIVAREGKTGPLIFVTSEYEYRNQAGKLLARHRETMVAVVKSPRL